MIGQADIQDYIRSLPPAIAYHVDALDSDFWKAHRSLLPKSSASVFWTRERQFTQLRDATKKTKSYDQGWDGYNSPSPNDEAIDITLGLLSKLRDSALNPYSVLPSADGGIGISFRGRNNKRAVLEILNEGTSSYVLYGAGHTTESGAFDSNTDWVRILQLLEEYL